MPAQHHISRRATSWVARLQEAARGRVVVLGIGNDLRADDGAGSLVAQKLRECHSDVTFDGGQAPENLAGPIRRARPDTIVVVDAASFGGAPGEVRIVSGAGYAAGLTLGTHALPAGTFLIALAEATGAPVHLVAIQVATTAFGAEMTPEVAAAADRVARELTAIIDATSGRRNR